MLDIITIREKFKELRCCVVIPTYNNAKTLEKLIRDVEDYTGDIFIVNDGSTDETGQILARFAYLEIIKISKNTGKGWAIRQGFKRAHEKGFRYAITIDSDGQHFPEDFHKFLEVIEKMPDSIVIGSRNMNQPGIPEASNFGNRFSVFWFRVQTGIKIPDVQSGFRLYPLDKLAEKHFYSTKYEFEAEVLVRMSWHGVKIQSVPVRVYYAPKGERLSHLRKFRDVARISFVNAVLVFMAILWIRPFLFIRDLRKRSIRQLIRQYVLESKDSNAKIACSLGIGLFMGVFPIWGWQMMAALGVAIALRLNKFVTVAASNISMPPMLPFVIFLSYYTGGLVLNMNTSNLNYSGGITFAWVKNNLWQYIAGSIIFGLVFGILIGLITYIILEIFRKRKKTEN